MRVHDFKEKGYEIKNLKTKQQYRIVLFNQKTGIKKVFDVENFLPTKGWDVELKLNFCPMCGEKKISTNTTFKTLNKNCQGIQTQFILKKRVARKNKDNYFSLQESRRLNPCVYIHLYR